MVRTRCNQGWARGGSSLLWETEALGELVDAADVVSLRQLFALSGNWPNDLPAAGGDTLVVSGLEGCLDVLAPEDAERWIEEDLRQVMLSFQDHYEGQAGLVFWISSKSNRFEMNRATEEYHWKLKSGASKTLPIGRLLWSGAEQEVERLLNKEGADFDSSHWIGLHLPRIS